MRLVLFLCAALGVGISLPPIRGRAPRVWVLDIGQSDSTVIKQGSRYITISGSDTPRPDCGKQVIGPFLMSRALGIVDATSLTHADPGHTNSPSYLVSRGSGIRMERVILNPTAETDSHYTKLMTSLRKDPETELLSMGAGDIYGNFHCLQSPWEVLPKEANEQSLVLLLTANDKRCFFTGDAGQPNEKKSLERFTAPGRAVGRAAFTDIDLLRAGHHSSRGASSEAFLALLSPGRALISCRQGNSYGHPHAEAMEHLRRHAGQVHSIVKEGALSVELLPS